jgi:anthranilate phosphoribosyltransferase
MQSFASELRRLADAAARPATERNPLSEADSHRLFGAILDGGVDDIETGALLALTGARDAPPVDLHGICRAARERANVLRVPGGLPCTVLIPAYAGPFAEPAFAFLLAGFLRALNLPVLLHCALESSFDLECGPPAMPLACELGFTLTTTIADTEQALRREGLAVAPIQVLSPSFAHLFGVATRLGMQRMFQKVAQTLDPTGGEALRFVCVRQGDAADFINAVAAMEGRWLVAESPPGTPRSALSLRPQLTRWQAGRAQRLYRGEHTEVLPARPMPATASSRVTADWIGKTLRGIFPMPQPVVHVAAACLVAAGATTDLNHARALASIAAVDLGRGSDPVARRLS